MIVMRCSNIKKYKLPQIKFEKEILNYFQSSFIEDGCISYVFEYRTSQFMDYQG
jgi:hypothetical protein